MGKFIFEIGEQRFVIEDLGEPMNSQFLSLHEGYFSSRVLDHTKFREQTFHFFDESNGDYDEHDRYFNNFTTIWHPFLKRGQFADAVQLWKLALSIAHEWEDIHQDKRIHKGTPYYFWAVTCILSEDLEKGFLLMHQAVEEDRETGETDRCNTPACSFVSLDHENKRQFFLPKVKEIAEFVDEKLTDYRSSRSGTLTLSDLKSNFLELTAVQEVVFYFVFELFRLKKVGRKIDQSLTHNTFGSLLQASVIFDLCRIIDNAIKHKNPNQWNFREHLTFLSSRSSLQINNTTIGHEHLNGKFTKNFSNTLQELLDSRYRFRYIPTPQRIDEDFAITYGFRNFGAHRIENQPVIYQNFEEILQRVLNALFFCVENLYM